MFIVSRQVKAHVIPDKIVSADTCCARDSAIMLFAQAWATPTDSLTVSYKSGFSFAILPMSLRLGLLPTHGNVTGLLSFTLPEIGKRVAVHPPKFVLLRYVVSAEAVVSMLFLGVYEATKFFALCFLGSALRLFRVTQAGC
jgi:hypothetical protein